MDNAGQALDAAGAWRLLGAAPSAGPAAVQAAFRAAVKAAHPDRPGGDARRLAAIVAARAFLQDAPSVRDPIPSAAPRPVLRLTPAEAARGAWRLARAADGRRLRVALPPGLRSGMQVRVAGAVMSVAVARA